MLQTSPDFENRQSGDSWAQIDDTERANIAPPMLLQYWHVVLRFKWIIIALVIAALAAGLVLTLLATPQYTANSRVEISRDKKKITNLEGLEAPESGRDQEFYQTQYSLLQARSLAERVSRQLRLAADDDFLNAHGANADKSGIFAGNVNRPLNAGESKEREERIVSLLLDNISIAPVRGSSLVDIKYSSASATLSAQIANAWSEQFIVQSMDRRFASTADARKFLEGRLADLRARLETSESDLVDYATTKGIVSLGRTKNAEGRTDVDRTLVSSDLEALNSALASATADRIAAQSKASQRNGGANSEALTNPAISQLRQKRAEVAAEYAKMMVQFEPGYPAARALSEQIRALDSSIAREENRVSSSRTSEFREAIQREADLKQRVGLLKEQMNKQQRDSIQYNIYQREADTNRELYDGMLQRYKEIGIAGTGANNIAIVDTAKIPDDPSSPNLPLNLILSLFAGLSLAAIATIALNQIDEGLRDPMQVNQLLQLPLLGSIPDAEDDDTLLLLQDSKSPLSEAYLSIRSNLAFSTDHGVPRSMMVTSTRPAEGKSTSSFAHRHRPWADGQEGIADRCRYAFTVASINSPELPIPMD